MTSMSVLASWSVVVAVTLAVVAVGAAWFLVTVGHDYDRGVERVARDAGAPIAYGVDVPLPPRVEHRWNAPLYEHESHTTHIREATVGGCFLWCGTCGHTIVTEHMRPASGGSSGPRRGGHLRG